jgi:Zn-dependent peptidase ImmA (M78 family)/DNA-binding XRE family transcriptional regulator
MFLGDRIRQARETRFLTQEQLADQIGRSKALVAQVEAGFKMPTAEFIENVADRTKFPLSFFNAPPHLEFPIAEILLRAKRAIKRREVLDTVRYAEHLFAIYSAITSRLKRAIPVTIPDCPNSPYDAAHTMRKVLGYEKDVPILKLVHSIERAGVCFLALPTIENREAFCVWLRGEVTDIPVIAASAGKTDGDRFRLSVAHELGHLVMHKSFLRKSNKEVEAEAFAFAAELLMPEAAMRKELIAPVTLTSLSRLKPRWGVSIAALIRRAHDLSILTTRLYYYLFHQKTILGMREREPENLDVPLEKPRLLRKIAEMVYGNPIDFRQFSSDTNILPHELRGIMADYEGRDSELTISAQPKVVRFPSGARVRV